MLIIFMLLIAMLNSVILCFMFWTLATAPEYWYSLVFWLHIYKPLSASGGNWLQHENPGHWRRLQWLWTGTGQYLSAFYMILLLRTHGAVEPLWDKCVTIWILRYPLFPASIATMSLVPLKLQLFEIMTTKKHTCMKCNVSLLSSIQNVM